VYFGFQIISLAIILSGLQHIEYWYEFMPTVASCIEHCTVFSGHHFCSSFY